jgi:hypothetical protein
MNSPATTPTNGERACPRCGTVFTCGLAARQERCWCFDYPRILTVEDTGREGCLCPTCLQAAIDARLNLEAKGTGV